MLRYDIRTGVKKIKTKTAVAVSGASLASVGLIMALVMPLAAKAAVSQNYSLFGDASIVSPGETSNNAAEATSTGTNAFGGVSFSDPSSLTVAQLQTLSTDYMFKVGSCGLGSPRFSVSVTNGTNSGHIFFYLGPAPSYTGCPPNVWTPSGNLANPANLVDTSQLPGGTFYQAYAAAQLAYGTYSITGISLVVDGPGQTADFDNTQINTTTYDYEAVPTKDSCKNNGWKTLQDANNKSFKNQGDCVSYFATNGRNTAAGN